MGNEEKLDLFFNTIKERVIITPDSLYYGGLRTKKYIFSTNEVREYLKRFEDDDLIKINPGIITLTEKGRVFKGYRHGSRKSKISSVLKILSIPALIAISANITTLYDFIERKYDQWSSKDSVSYQKQEPKPTTSDTTLLKSKIDTSSKKEEQKP